MADYPNILRGLEQMVNFPSARLDQYVKQTLAPFIPNYHNTSGDDERQSLLREFAVLRDDRRYTPAKSELHIFQFDKDECFMMDITDNRREEGEQIHLPFPVCFLDVDVQINDIRHTGILLAENEGILMDTNQRAIESVQEIQATLKEMRPLKPGVFIVPYPNISATIFAPTKGYNQGRENIVPYVVRRYSLLPINQTIAVGTHLEEATGEMKELDFNFNIGKALRRNEYLSVERIVLNFLDLLDTPDIRIAHIPAKDDPNRQRRGQLGHYPPRDIVRLSLPIKRYLEEMRQGGHFTYNHAFWVRGHFRHFKSDRYARSGLQGTKEWIPPYVKGKGILVKKKYEVEGDFRKV